MVSGVHPLGISWPCITGLIDAAAHDDGSGIVTRDCIDPGAIGVYDGVADNVYASDLETGTSLDFVTNGFAFNTYTLVTGGPSLVSPTVIQTPSGHWALSGDVYTPYSIYNYRLVVYPRDARGLLFAQLLAFPGNLGTLAPGASTPFQTDVAYRPFTTYRAYSPGSTTEGRRARHSPSASGSALRRRPV